MRQSLHTRSALGATLVLILTVSCATVPVQPSPSGGERQTRASVLDHGIDAGADPRSRTAAALADLAQSLLASPYRYSGSDPSGFDCSGLTSYLFGSVGLSLPRTARDQSRAGNWVPPDELEVGDLVFFGDQRGKPFHVGLVVSQPGDPLTMIHASTSKGVIRTEVLSSSYWMERLLFGRRMLGYR